MIKPTKLTKFASMTIVALLALCASSAKAGIITSRQFVMINCSFVAVQQDRENFGVSSNVFVSTVMAEKINNKDLLSFLATAFNTSWPAGARLALDNFSGDIFVVDKTGTNPVFNASIGINVGGTNIAYFRFDSDDTVFSGKLVDKIDGSLKQTRRGIVSFALFNEHNGVITTDLGFQGIDTSKIAEKFGATTDIISVHESATVAGDGTLDSKWTVLKGKVTGSGKFAPIII